MKLTLKHPVRMVPFLAFVLLLLTAMAARAQSTYSNAVMSLNPAGYWPMHEVEPAAQGDTETNYGSLGLLGTAYYPDWATGTSKGMIRGYTPGALANDPDPCVSFVHSITSGSGFTSANYANNLWIPHTSPLSTLTPPFTVECWVDITNATAAGNIVWGQFGFDELNSAGTASGGGEGVTLNWNGGFFCGYQKGGVSFNTDNSASKNPSNQWYYAVLTCDSSSNSFLYLNGVPTTGGNSVVGKYMEDSWTPLSISGGRGGTRAIGGYIDEFAIYTNALAGGDIAQKYSDATTGAAGQYFDDVTNDNPVIYLRMDAPTAYTPPAVATWPAMMNYGSAGANGVYTPGTMPGIMPGPTFNGVQYGGVTNNSVMLSGISSFGNAGYAPAFDPTGSNANFTVTAVFRGYPADGRFESIVGHGTNSWQLGMSTNGCLVFNAGNGNHAAGGTGTSPGDVTTAVAYNDGNWHQVVAVNATNVISIYVDNVLVTNGTPTGITTTNIIPGNPAGNVMIGSDPSYTNNPAGVGRQFAGQICDVAFFASALTAGQVQTLYNGSGVTPFIDVQPLTGRAAHSGLGTQINFGVTAAGSSLVYQWYFNTSSNYSGATRLVDNVVHYTNSTTAQLTVTNLTGSDNGYYYVVITNNYGSVTSILASLTIGSLDVWKGNINNNWDIATTLNWTFNGSPSDYNDGNIVQFDDTANTFNVNLAANVSPNGITVTNTRNAYTLSGTNGILSGVLLKTGTNTLTLAVTDSSGGGTMVSAGTLVIGDGTSNGLMTASSIVDNGTVLFDRSDANGSYSSGISGSGTVEINAETNGVFGLGSSNSYLGNTIILSGTVQSLGASAIPGLAGGGILIVSNPAVLDMEGTNVTVNGLSGNGAVDNYGATAAILTVGTNNPNSTFAGSISNTVGSVSLAKEGSGILFLTGTNYFTGGLSIDDGIVNVASFSDYLDAGTPNAGPSALGQRASYQETTTAIGLNFNSGTLQYTGSTPQETDRQIRLLNTVNTIDASGSNPNATLYWSYGDTYGHNVNLVNTVGTRTLQLTGSNTGTNTFDIQIADEGVNGTAVTKTGVGTWYILGPGALAPSGNEYSGATTISNGLLVISTTHNDNSGLPASANGLGTFAVKDGAMLGVTDGGNYEPALMSTLTVGNSAGATLEFLNIPSSGVAMISATSTVVHGIGTIVCSTNNLTAGTVYPLLAYGTLSGSFSLAPMPGPLYYQLTNDTVNIDLVALAAPPFNPNPTNMVFSVSGNTLTLSWPADHTGWQLQVQTNSLSSGLGTNWFTIPNSGLSNSYTNTMDPTRGALFYRMILYP